MAKKVKVQASATGWNAIFDYSTDIKGGFSLGSGFNPTTGIYTAEKSGTFHVAANSGVQGASSGPVRLIVAVNGDHDVNNGLHRSAVDRF